MSNQNAIRSKIVITAASLVTGLLGFAGSVLAAMYLGLQFHHNYEFYAIGTAVGNLLMIGGTAAGASIPWLLRSAVKKA
jgi:hypothetical protein